MDNENKHARMLAGFAIGLIVAGGTMPLIPWYIYSMLGITIAMAVVYG